MPIFAHVVNDSPVKIWGLTSRQRQERVLRAAGVTNLMDDIAELPDNGTALLFRGDYLFDDRVIQYMVQTRNIVLQITQDSVLVPVAVHVASEKAHEAREALLQSAGGDSLPGVKTETLETLSVSFQQRLLKFEPPFVLPVDADNCRLLERRLFDWSYKGVTDLVTKWAWPRPAQWVVGRCVDLGLRPNHVTIIGLLLVLLAGWLFADGRYFWGLLAGWLMTFFDTVDGKLARVTVTSSKFGHYFDHIIDLIHPPVWYILWGIGLGISHFSIGEIPLTTAYWLIVIGYIVGRVVEGAFLAWFGKFGIFCWRPIDSYFRLITARRNPCLLLLTASAILGRPNWGLFAVTIWTIVSSIFLLVRLSMAVAARMTSGPIRSWFLDIDQTDRQQPLAVRLFTHRAND